MYCRVRNRIYAVEGLALFLLAFSVACLLVFVALFDSANGIVFYAESTTHMYVTVYFAFVTSVWGYYCLVLLSRVELGAAERKWHLSAWKLFVFNQSLMMFSMTQFILAHSVYSNFLFNEMVECVVEYLCVVTALAFPYFLTKVTNVSVRVALKGNK